MKSTFIRTGLLGIAIALSSCSNDETFIPETSPELNLTVSEQNPFPSFAKAEHNYIGFENMHRDFNLKINEAVIPTDCSPTPFNDVVINQGFAGYDYLGFLYLDEYSYINRVYSFVDPDPQYFGDEGQYTNYVKNRTRSLEKFWDMSNEITVNGQHNSTLGDPVKVAYVYQLLGLSEESAQNNAAIYLQINEASTFLIESPLLSFDGFASSTDLIVIGDGLVELASEAGVEDKVVWSGILAHEWAHQIQFDNRPEWYPNGAADNAPEATRYTELEADFFAAYYLTHKRGATYNWKRVVEFNELFFNIGDCQFTSPGHHGTPAQRMRAAEAGYEFAQSLKAKGKLLTADEVHQAYMDSFESIVFSAPIELPQNDFPIRE